jgi:hypothetical protein
MQCARSSQVHGFLGERARCAEPITTMTSGARSRAATRSDRWPSWNGWKRPMRTAASKRGTVSVMASVMVAREAGQANLREKLDARVDDRERFPESCTDSDRELRGHAARSGRVATAASGARPVPGSRSGDASRSGAAGTRSPGLAGARAGGPLPYACSEAAERALPCLARAQTHTMALRVAPRRPARAWRACVRCVVPPADRPHYIDAAPLRPRISHLCGQPGRSSGMSQRARILTQIAGLPGVDGCRSSLGNRWRSPHRAGCWARRAERLVTGRDHGAQGGSRSSPTQ